MILLKRLRKRQNEKKFLAVALYFLCVVCAMAEKGGSVFGGKVVLGRIEIAVSGAGGEKVLSAVLYENSSPSLFQRSLQIFFYKVQKSFCKAGKAAAFFPGENGKK